MAIKINDPLRNAMVSSVLSSLGTSGILKVYGGTQPGTGGAATTQGIIVQIEGISWNAGSNGTATITESKTGTSGTAGTAVWGRLSDSTGTAYVLDGACGTATSSDFVIDAAEISVDAEVTLTAATLIQPGS